MHKFHIILSIAIIGLVACSKTESDPIDPTGCFQEMESPDIVQFAGNTHRLCFNFDGTIDMEVEAFTDVIDLMTTCSDAKTLIIEGTYSFSADQLTVDGTVVGLVSVFDVSDCPLNYTYDRGYDYEEISEDVILLNPDSPEVEQIRLVRE